MPRDTTLRPGSRRSYSMSQFGHSEQGSRQGKHVLKSNLADYWSPAYGDGFTVIRALPVRNPDEPTQWEPYRFSTSPNEFGDWVRRYPAVRSMGDPGVTFIIRDPADPTPLDPATTPGWVLFNAIDRAVANGQDQQGWAALLRGGRNRGAVLARPSEIFLTQCFVMQHKQKIYLPPAAAPKGFGPEEKLIVMELSSNAGVTWLSLLDQVREGYQGDPNDFEHSMLAGDPVSLQHGRFVTFYKLADGDPRQRQTVQTTGWNQPVPGRGGQGPGQEPIGYGVFMEDSFMGVPARLLEFEQQIAAKVRPWDELLHFPTIEEQAVLLADKFPPDVILYAWRDRPEWIPEAVRRRAVNAHSVGSPGTPFAPPGAPVSGWGQPAYQHVGGLTPPAGPLLPAPAQPPVAVGWGGPPQAAPPGTVAPLTPVQPVAAAWGGPPQMGPPGSDPTQQGYPQQGYPQPAQQPVYQQPVQQPVYQQPVYQQPVQQQQPVQAAPAAGWGSPPAVPPAQPGWGTPAMAWVGQNAVTDPAVPTGMPVGAAPFVPPQQPAALLAATPGALPPAPPVMPPAGVNQPPAGFAAPPPPLPGATGQPTRAALALAAAQAAVARSPAA